MITARWDGSYSLTIEGHAGYAPQGQDIVCAGASTLAGTLVAELWHRQETGQGKLTATDDGQTYHIGFTPHAKFGDEIERVYAMIWRGFLLLADSYGAFVDAKLGD